MMQVGGLIGGAGLGALIGRGLAKSDIKTLTDFFKKHMSTNIKLSPHLITEAGIHPLRASILGALTGLGGVLTAHGLYRLFKSKEEAPIWKGMGVGGALGLGSGILEALRHPGIEMWVGKEKLTTFPFKTHKLGTLMQYLLTGLALGGGIGAIVKLMRVLRRRKPKDEYTALLLPREGEKIDLSHEEAEEIQRLLKERLPQIFEQQKRRRKK